MKIKLNIKRQVTIPPDDLEEKINRYLIKNYYRIIERGSGYVIFIDDEYSDRKQPRSDYHTRIGEGKLEFHATGQGTFVKLTYFNSVLYPFLLTMLFVAYGMYYNTVAPIIFSLAFSIPFIFKIYNMNDRVFDDILES